jgi:uncharacterized protein (TIGR02001 family)
MKSTKTLSAIALLAGLSITAPVHAFDLSANASVTNNYIWRGLTQTTNDAAVQGGIDLSTDPGFYIGTWVSNVNYGADDNFSYEHDMYAGWAGGNDVFTWDVGYLYYNYDDEAEFDFGEIYGSIGLYGFNFSAYVLANTEANESPGQDFGFGEAYYLSADYSITVGPGIELGVHGGYHNGDFVEAFNAVTDSYYDWNFSLSKGGFGFMITSSNADGPASEGAFDNDEAKFVVSYTVDFDLLAEDD